MAAESCFGRRISLILRGHASCVTRAGKVAMGTRAINVPVSAIVLLLTAPAAAETIGGSDVRDVPARDEARDETPKPEAQSERRWYGWQTLATDGAAVGLGYAAATGGADEALGLSIAIYAFGAPT